MHWITVFDLDRVGFKQWYVSAFGLIFVAIGLFHLSFATMRRLMAGMMVVAGVLISFFTLATTLSAYRDARSALHDGRAVVVEGAIENFHPMPRAGHDNERFDAGGRHFEYSDYDITPGFNTAQSHGGPIHAGEYVRVTSYKGVILRLEVRKQGR